MYHNSPILKGKPAPFLNEVVERVLFCEKPNDMYCKKKDPTYLCCSTCGYVVQARSTEEEYTVARGGTNK